jgi:hypothetical protein
MNSPEPHLPAPRTYKHVPFVPAVDPDDLKRVWNVRPPWTATSHKDACSPGADVGAVVQRRHMIGMLVGRKLLEPWAHDELLDDAVFRVVAEFPLHERQIMPPYMIPGDELYPFDPNAFLQRLVRETGIAHEWKPLPTTIPDGGRSHYRFSVSGPVEDPDRAARNKTRDLLLQIWRRFSGIDNFVGPEEARAQLSNVWFDDFLIANTDLVQRVVGAYRQNNGVGMDLFTEIEQRASKR